MVKNRLDYSSQNDFEVLTERHLACELKSELKTGLLGWLLGKSMIRLVFFLIPICYACTNEWDLRRDEAGIQIYQQSTASGYAITRSITEMETTLNTLVTLMSDRSTCQQWVYACKEGRLIKQINAEERLDYMVVDTPLLFADRDMYIHTIKHFDPQSKTVEIRLNGKEDYDKGQPNRVRIKSIEGFWRIQQITPNKVKVVYQIYSNPQVFASVFLDAYIVESAFQTLSSLEKLVKD